MGKRRWRVAGQQRIREFGSRVAQMSLTFLPIASEDVSCTDMAVGTYRNVPLLSRIESRLTTTYQSALAADEGGSVSPRRA